MKVRTGGTREQAPEGVHMARIVNLTDLGHQPGFTWAGGEADSAYKYEITYELVNARMEDERPFWVSEEVTNTDNEKGKLYSRIRATNTEFNNILGLLDSPVMVTLEYNAKGYPKVVNVAGVPEGIDVAPLSVGASYFDIYAEVPDMEDFTAMSDFKQGKIRKALDFDETNLSKSLSALEEEVKF